MGQLPIAMISSTARDLPEHRDQVRDACLARKLFPIMMEHLPASPAEAAQVSTSMVDQADVYLGVFAHRYGYVPNGHDKSVTEMEYDRAVERGIPRLIFVMHEDHPLRAGDVETGPGAAKLAALRERLLREHVVCFFRSPADLRAHVLNSLAEYLARPAADTVRVAGRASGADLTISSLDAPRRLRPLSGHPVLPSSGQRKPVYTGGVHVSFTLAHNGAGRQPISLHAIELELVRYEPGARPELGYELEGADLIGAGVAKPHVFNVSLFGESVGPARWVVDAKAGTFAQAKSANFLDTDEPRVLTFAADGADLEELQGTVLAQDPGLYEFRFLFHYSVGGEDRQQASEAALVYFDE